MAGETEGQASGQSSSQGASQAGAASASHQESGSAQTQTQTQAVAGQQTSEQQQQQTKPARPEGIPDKYWNAEKGVDYGTWSKDFNEHVAFRAAEESKRLTLPQSADAYKIELPADFKPPEGVTFEFKKDDPLLAQAKTMAHGMGISQENFSKLLGLYAGAQVATSQQVTAARNAEIGKLGTTGPARIDALTTFFKAQLGEAEGKQFMSRVFTASDVQIAEAILAKIANGPAPFKGGGREPDIGGKVDDATWAKMTYPEQKAYAERHSRANGAAA